MARVAERWRRHRWVFLWLAFFLAAATLGLHGLSDTVSRRAALLRDVRFLRGRVVELQERNERLRSHLRRLRSDRRYLERVIRERLGWVKPGEILYRFPAQSAPPGGP
ncbi:MAG: hypothetical protein KatS3mg076_1309 [Candidatus Binatia bacterium]|nr:MAG: hypothetical protein KatS3mg076_1309 [Candidatus Binatia bacterium]